MDLKSQQELYTVAYHNQHDEQHGIRVQGHSKPKQTKAKRRNPLLQLLLTLAQSLRF